MTTSGSPLTHAALLAVLAGLAGCAAAPARYGRDAQVVQVSAAEIAFAKTMADRDHAAFLRHLSDEAIFIGGDGQAQRGKAAVGAHWQRFFNGPTAPFAWRPDSVEVLESGTLALSSGPVTAAGKVVARFQSVWRLEADGRWRVVFDRGAAACDCPPRP